MESQSEGTRSDRLHRDTASLSNVEEPVVEAAQSTDVDKGTSADLDESRVAVSESEAGVNLSNTEYKLSVKIGTGTQG